MLKNLRIPKGKRDLLTDANQHEKQELQQIVSNSFLHPGDKIWTLHRVQLIHNDSLEQAFREAKQDVKAECWPTSKKDVAEVFAYKLCGNVKNAAMIGLHVDPMHPSVLGNSVLGVHFLRHADLCLELAHKTNPEKKEYVILMCKVLLGKAKSVPGNTGHNASLEPTPNHHSHLCAQTARPSDSPEEALTRSYVYIYEYDEDGLPSNCPRTCLPYAVMTFARQSGAKTKSSQQASKRSILRSYQVALNPASAAARKPSTVQADHVSSANRPGNKKAHPSASVGVQPLLAGATSGQIWPPLGARPAALDGHSKPLMSLGLNRRMLPTQASSHSSPVGLAQNRWMFQTTSASDTSAQSGTGASVVSRGQSVVTTSTSTPSKARSTSQVPVSTAVDPRLALGKTKPRCPQTAPPSAEESSRTPVSANAELDCNVIGDSRLCSGLGQSGGPVQGNATMMDSLSYDPAAVEMSNLYAPVDQSQAQDLSTAQHGFNMDSTPCSSLYSGVNATSPDEPVQGMYGPMGYPMFPPGPAFGFGPYGYMYPHPGFQYYCYPPGYSDVSTAVPPVDHTSPAIPSPEMVPPPPAKSSPEMEPPPPGTSPPEMVPPPPATPPPEMVPPPPDTPPPEMVPPPPATPPPQMVPPPPDTPPPEMVPPPPATPPPQMVPTSSAKPVPQMVPPPSANPARLLVPPPSPKPVPQMVPPPSANPARLLVPTSLGNPPPQPSRQTTSLSAASDEPATMGYHQAASDYRQPTTVTGPSIPRQPEHASMGTLPWLLRQYLSSAAENPVLETDKNPTRKKSNVLEPEIDKNAHELKQLNLHKEQANSSAAAATQGLGLDINQVDAHASATGTMAMSGCTLEINNTPYECDAESLNSNRPVRQREENTPKDSADVIDVNNNDDACADAVPARSRYSTEGSSNGRCTADCRLSAADEAPATELNGEPDNADVGLNNISMASDSGNSDGDPAGTGSPGAAGDGCMFTQYCHPQIKVLIPPDKPLRPSVFTQLERRVCDMYKEFQACYCSLKNLEAMEVRASSAEGEHLRRKVETKALQVASLHVDIECHVTFYEAQMVGSEIPQSSYQRKTLAAINMQLQELENVVQELEDSGIMPEDGLQDLQAAEDEQLRLQDEALNCILIPRLPLDSPGNQLRYLTQLTAGSAMSVAKEVFLRKKVDALEEAHLVDDLVDDGPDDPDDDACSENEDATEADKAPNENITHDALPLSDTVCGKRQSPFGPRAPEKRNRPYHSSQ